MTSAAPYAIGDLARLAGVSRRTVRYYVQEELIAPPLGVGRGNHYGPEHLDQILRIKAMQEAGKTLDEIRQQAAPKQKAEPKLRSVYGRGGTQGRAAEHARGGAYERVASPPERSIWRRLTLAPGVELQVAGNVRLPSPGRIQELAEWCRLHLVPHTDPEDEANDV